jgi:hypothetical protein
MQNNNNSSLERSIIATLCYFDAFDYPLTLMEIWKWLFGEGNIKKCSLEEISEVIKGSQAVSEKIESENGFYFLNGRKDIVKTRKRRYQVAEGKMKRAIKISKVLRYIPFVRMIAVCNNLAYGNAKKNSDIDFFIVVARNRLWQTRFFVSLITHLMRMRRHNGFISNRICLSFYVTDDYLDLEKLMITPIDPYFIYWFGQLVPIYDSQGYFNKLVSMNKWINGYLPNLIFNKPVQRRAIKDNKWSFALKNMKEVILGGVLGNFLERILKAVQKKKMIRNKESKLREQNTAVIIEDDILKFHENDRRKQYAEQFSKKMTEELIQTQ